MNNLEIIQEWYKNQCNGDWEHENGIKINTTDNPGWSVTIDLVDTSLDHFYYHEESINSLNDWFIINSNGKIFSASGDFHKLNFVLEKFIYSFALPNIKKAETKYTVYELIDNTSDIKVYRNLEAKMINMIEFEITSIPKLDKRDLKVLDVNDFEKIDFNKVSERSSFELGNIVRCDLVFFYDYPCLAIKG